MQISSRYNPKEVEPKILKKWLCGNYFLAKADPKLKPFCIVIPPPNITGVLHMGHALNNTIQDVLIRRKRMQGYCALWMPGTDHAGIATQNVVEKELAKKGLKKEDIGREKFIKMLWEWRDKYGSTIIEQLKRLGASCDWSRTRFTLDKDYCRAVRQVFIKLWKKGLIYQGNYIINWCPRCQTALADEEAPYQQHQGFLYYIKYPLKNSPEYVVVATTRPETMLGDVAVAVNPKDKRYKTILGKTLILPFLEKEIKVIEDDFVDPKFGTGAVKVTPAHDPNDFQIANRHSLTSVLVMNPDGTMNENAAEFSGLDRFQARELIVESLRKQKLLSKVESHCYTVGHCYRCQTVIEPYLSRQWFVKMKPLAEPAIKAVKRGEIKFYPQRWKKVYLNWMQNLQDWCISRQIWWGHRLPVWQCNCQADRNSKFLPRLGVWQAGKIQNSKLKYRKSNNFLISETKPRERCLLCGAEYKQIPDVLDTWFSSWLWPFATFGWPFKKSKIKNQKSKIKDFKYFYPTDVLVTAPEIIFFWVARMVMAGFEFIKEKPFKDILIHGTVRDAQGRKMSKSLGNIIDPIEIIDKFGADALRFSLMLLASGGSDVYLSNEKFLVGRNFSNKLWNATRFILLKVKENAIELTNLEFKIDDQIDKWVLKELNETIEKVSQNLDRYFLNEAAKKIYNFFWHIFCDWYIEIIKNNFTFNKAKITVHILISSMKLLHPFMPFITEEIFELIKNNTSLSLEEALMCARWPKKTRLKINQNELKEIQGLIDIVRNVRNIKAILGIASKKVSLQLRASDDKLIFFKAHKLWLQRLSQSEDIEFLNKTQRLKRVLYVDELCEVNLLIEDIKEDDFCAALDKKIRKFEELLGKTKDRLSNPKFIENAPPEKIKEEKAKHKDFLIEIRTLKRLKNAFESKS